MDSRTRTVIATIEEQIARGEEQLAELEQIAAQMEDLDLPVPAEIGELVARLEATCSDPVPAVLPPFGIRI